MKIIFLLLCFGCSRCMFAQQPMPVIKANSKTVSINDGGYLDKNAWSLSPQAKPDIYTADRTRKTKWVSFYTDIDSIRIKVKPGSVFNFIVLLNGKDSCYTRVVSAIPPAERQKTGIDKPDTIPFTLTDFNAIAVNAIINHADTLKLHFDMGTFEFRFTKDAIVAKTKLLASQLSTIQGGAKPNFNKMDTVSALQMGTLSWTNPTIVATGNTAHQMDGRFGWNLFEGKKVAIDYDHNLLIVSSSLPKNLKGYTKAPMNFIRSFVCMKASFLISDSLYTGNFLLDTGSDQAIVLDNEWTIHQHFPSNLPLIKTSVITDPRGVQYESKIVRAPMLKINNFELTSIPTFILGNKNPVGFEINYLGNDLLKRFNMLFDFKNDIIYFKPNKLTTVPYRQNA